MMIARVSAVVKEKDELRCLGGIVCRRVFEQAPYLLQDAVVEVVALPQEETDNFLRVKVVSLLVHNNPDSNFINVGTIVSIGQKDFVRLELVND